VNIDERIDIGKHIFTHSIFASREFADVFIDGMEEILMIAKLKGIGIEDRLLHSQSVAHSDGIDKKTTNVELSDEHNNFVLSLTFCLDDDGFCHTIKLLGNMSDFMRFATNGEQTKEEVLYEDFWILNEDDLKIALDYIKRKI
jgi:hypothetical protein